MEASGEPEEAAELLCDFDGELSPAMWYVLGNCHQDMAEHGRAIYCYHRSLEMEPDRSECWCNLGISEQETGNLQDAYRCYCRSIASDPGNYNALINKAGLLDDYFGDYEEALECINAAERIAPGTLYTCYTKANILSDLGRYEDALEYYDRAIQIESGHYGFYNNKGLCLKRMGRYEEALEYFRMALQAGGGEDEIYNNMGLAYHFIGKDEEAKRCFVRSAQLGCESAVKNLNLFF